MSASDGTQVEGWKSRESRCDLNDGLPALTRLTRNIVKTRTADLRRWTRARRLLAHYLNHELPAPLPGIELDKHNLLPRAEHETTVGERHCKRWAQKGCADVT